MELASMLAGERFTDHPACASLVVGAFLRAYNDGVDDRRRQTLLGWASRVVGTRAAEEVETARAQACAAWIERILGQEGRFRWRRWRLALEACRIDGRTPQGIGRAAGRLAVMVAREDGDLGHARVLALLDELVGRPHDERVSGGAPDAVVCASG
jgi:hypothetical protein